LATIPLIGQSRRADWTGQGRILGSTEIIV